MEIPSPAPQTDKASAYRTNILVRFAHCDPAGIVFYPRYLEMFNGLVEDWFRDELGQSFQENIANGWGLPAVHLNVDFIASSSLGDVLSAALSVRKLGTSSITLDIVLSGPDGKVRVRGEVVVALIDAREHRSRPIPNDLRKRIAPFCVVK